MPCERDRVAVCGIGLRIRNQSELARLLFELLQQELDPLAAADTGDALQRLHPFLRLDRIDVRRCVPGAVKHGGLIHLLFLHLPS